MHYFQRFNTKSTLIGLFSLSIWPSSIKRISSRITAVKEKKKKDSLLSSQTIQIINEVMNTENERKRQKGERKRVRKVEGLRSSFIFYYSFMFFWLSNY